jgi:WD40 repeat protein
MRRLLAGIRLSKVSAAWGLPGVALLLAAALRQWGAFGGDQIVSDAPWWVRLVVAAAGILLIIVAIVAGWAPRRELRPVAGFLGDRPRLPPASRLVRRPELVEKAVAALCAGAGPVALTGIGGAGKSTLATVACLDERVRQRFRDGVTWLAARPNQDPVALLSDLARRLGVPASETGFGTVAQGRDTVGAALRGKRVLIVVDNVWEAAPVAALTLPDCGVMFTTRESSLATTFAAAQVTVDELTQGQALELLGCWAGPRPAGTPAQARALCAQLGNLALGVTMAGAMIAQGRSYADVIALVGQNLAKVRAELDPPYEHADLMAAIEAGISDLPETSQDRYVRLAVFAGHDPFTRAAAEVLWAPGLSEAEVGDLLADLTGRSLLAAAGDGWYTAHDLQYDMLKHRLGKRELAPTRARLLDSYRARYPAGWASSVTDPYLAGALAGQLHDAGRDSELRGLLADVTWIQARLTAGQLPGLIADYRHAEGDPLCQEIGRALRLAAHILATDPGQVRGQLTGRLMGHPSPAVTYWATTLASEETPIPWLAPLTPTLIPTTGALNQFLTGPLGSGIVMAVAGATAISSARGVSMGSEFDDVLRVWDLATRRERAALTGHKRRVWSVAVTPDGATLLSGGDDCAVRVWDVAAERERAKLTGHTEVVWSVAVTEDGATGTSGSADGTVRVWDLITGRERAKLTGHTDQVNTVAVTPDGKKAISGGDDRTVRVWDVATGRERAKLTGHTGPVHTVTVTPDGATALSGGDDRTVRVWDLAAGRQRAIFTGHTGAVRKVAVTPDGSTAISSEAGGVVRVWDVATGCQRAAFTDHGGSVSSVALAPDAATAFGGGTNGVVWVWDVATGHDVPTSTGRPGRVVAVALTPDGATALSRESGRVRMWDLATGQERTQLTGHFHAVSAEAVTPDGAMAISGDEDGVVRVWDLTTGRRRAELTGHHNYVYAVAVTEDGKKAISGGGYDPKVRVWDLAAGRERAALTGHLNSVYAVAVTEDGKKAISGGDDHTVRVWDLEAGRQLAMLTGPTGPVWAVAVTPDGNTAISGEQHGVVRIWDLATGCQRAALTGHMGTVNAVAITPDGGMAISGALDHTVRIWDMATGKEIARWAGDHPVIACAVLTSQPLKIAVGQSGGQPYILELRAQLN